MSQIVDCSEFCRLCLVKEQVNTPIFEEDGGYHQLSTKISTCLPVKVSREDSLPKRICDGCCYKVEQQYQFWNISLNAEKQFKQWLGISEDTETAKQNVNKIKKESTYDGPSASKRPKRNARRKAVQNIRQATAAQQSDSDSDIPLAARTVAPSIEVEPIAKDENDSDHHDFPEDNDSMDPPNFVNMNLEGEQDQAGPSGLQKAESTEPVEAAPATLNMEIEAGEGYSSTYAVHYPDQIELQTSSALQNDINVENKKIDTAETVYIKSEIVLNNSKNRRKNSKISVKKPKIKCEYCSSSYTPTRIKEHIKRKHKKPYTCADCNKGFSYPCDLKNHILKHTGEKPYPCDECDKSFTTKSVLNAHKKIHTGIKPFVCQVCNYSCRTNTNLRIHMLRHSNEKKYVCQICGKGFNQATSLNNHQYKHRTDRTGCHICGKTYSYEGDLKRHILTHDPNYISKTTFPCDLCKKKFFCKSALDFHIQVHHRGELLVCDVCGKGFKSKEGLEIHIRTHTGEKPFKCSFCEKHFISKNLLRVHARIHTGEKPFRCSDCDKCFTQRSSLTVHKRSHTGERPYPCHLCPKAFVTKTLLKTHQKSHGYV